MKRERAARPTLANAIARREYWLVTRSGTTRKVLLRFGKPVRIAELVSTQAYREGRLTWEGSSDLGLPAIESARSRGRPARNKARGPKRRR